MRRAIGRSKGRRKFATSIRTRDTSNPGLTLNPTRHPSKNRREYTARRKGSAVEKAPGEGAEADRGTARTRAAARRTRAVARAPIPSSLRHLLRASRALCADEWRGSVAPRSLARWPVERVSFRPERKFQSVRSSLPSGCSGVPTTQASVTLGHAPRDIRLVVAVAARWIDSGVWCVGLC